MRFVHRQRTGLSHHLPLFFAFMALLGSVVVFPGMASGAVANAAPVSATDGSEDPGVLLQMYLDWMLRRMKAPAPQTSTAEAYAQAVVQAYEASGLPKLRLLEVPQFIDTILVVKGLMSAHPDLLSDDTRLQLDHVLDEMLGGLVTEAQVAP